MKKFQIDFINFLLKAEALRFGEFVTKSGRVSPYFINTGHFSDGELLFRLGSFYAKAIIDFKLKPTLIFGPAYKGIPIAVATSIALKKIFKKTVRVAFNRKEAKDHGESGSIIGEIREGDRVLIIDDVLTAGTSIRESLALFSKFSGIKVIAALVSVDREEKGLGALKASRELEETFKIPVKHIVSIEETVKYLYKRKISGKTIITDELMQNIEEYRSKFKAV